MLLLCGGVSMFDEQERVGFLVDSKRRPATVLHIFALYVRSDETSFLIFSCWVKVCFK